MVSIPFIQIPVQSTFNDLLPIHAVIKLCREAGNHELCLSVLFLCEKRVCLLHNRTYYKTKLSQGGVDYSCLLVLCLCVSFYVERYDMTIWSPLNES